MKHRIMFDAETQSYQRNGWSKSKGLCLWETKWVWPRETVHVVSVSAINGRGDITSGCINIPLSAVPELIEKLQLLITEVKP